MFVSDFVSSYLRKTLWGAFTVVEILKRNIFHPDVKHECFHWFSGNELKLVEVNWHRNCFSVFVLQTSFPYAKVMQQANYDDVKNCDSDVTTVIYDVISSVDFHGGLKQPRSLILLKYYRTHRFSYFINHLSY